jgi:hypothetical protein
MTYIDKTEKLYFIRQAVARCRRERQCCLVARADRLARRRDGLGPFVALAVTVYAGVNIAVTVKAAVMGPVM